MFVMINDASILDRGEWSESLKAVLVQRTFIFDILASGISVTLLQGSEFRNSKVDSESSRASCHLPDARRSCPSSSSSVLTLRLANNFPPFFGKSSSLRRLLWVCRRPLARSSPAHPIRSPTLMMDFARSPRPSPAPMGIQFPGLLWASLLLTVSSFLESPYQPEHSACLH
jgi:hypothetical protein